MKIAILLALVVFARAQSGLDRPSLGLMLDSAGAARPVWGLPGTSIVADPIAASVLSFGCSASCLLKTDSSILAADQSVPAPPGTALFAFDASGAFVYFAAAKRLARWENGQFQRLDNDVVGEVVSIRSVNGAPEFAVRRSNAIRIVRSGNTTLDSLPLGALEVMLLTSGVLFSTREELILRGADSSEIRFPLAGVQSFAAMSPDYIEVRTSNGTFALRISAGREHLFELSEPQ